MKITKAVWETLPATVKDAFKPSAENAEEYTNGEEDAAALKSALAAEKAEKQKAAKERDDAKAAAAEADRLKAEEAARKSGDVAALEKSWQEKLAAAQKEAADAQAARDGYISQSEIQKVTGELSKLFVAPGAMSHMIQSRLKVELVEGKPLVRVLNADGTVSANSVKDLEKEFLTNADYKSILLASKGSGGGATDTPGGGGATPSKLADFKSKTEESAFANSNPEAYQAMVQAEA